jgi:membrane fusion protein (multidrug efflux system)
MERSTDQKATTGKRIKPIYIILPLVLIIGGYFATKKIIHAINYESTDNAQIESNAIPVVSRVAGYIDTVAVSDYSDVKEGQLIVKLDDREYSIAVSQAEADLQQAQADLVNARASLSNVGASENVASANTDVLRTRLETAERDYRRDQALFNDGAITQRQLEDSRANVETARKQVSAGAEQTTQAAVQSGTANAQIQRAQASIATRKAALDAAKLRLSYASIYAPGSGKVGKTNLQTGQFIQPGQPLLTIVNNEQFWIIANFKETQLKNLKTGQVANIEIDGYPDVKITGRISSFSEATGAKFSLLPPDNASGNYVKVTQRVPVKIDIDSIEKLKPILKAGLSVSVDVKVK